MLTHWRAIRDRKRRYKGLEREEPTNGRKETGESGIEEGETGKTKETGESGIEKGEKGKKKTKKERKIGRISFLNVMFHCVIGG